MCQLQGKVLRKCKDVGVGLDCVLIKKQETSAERAILTEEDKHKYLLIMECLNMD